MNYLNLTLWYMQAELQESNAGITTGKPSSSSWLNLQSNQLPSTALQLLGTKWGEETAASAYIIPKMLQWKLLQCEDRGDGGWSIHIVTNSYHCSRHRGQSQFSDWSSLESRFCGFPSSTIISLHLIRHDFDLQLNSTVYHCRMWMFMNCFFSPSYICLTELR